MYRRLYFLFPDVDHTSKVVDELLLKRININHMHAVAKGGTAMRDLPEASIFQRCDLRHSLFVGLGAGAVLGIVIGIVIHYVFATPLGGFMVASTIIGALLGAFASTMIGLMTDNVDLKNFQSAIESGKILLMVDIPKERVAEVEAMVQRLHPEAQDKGIESTMPNFP